MRLVIASQPHIEENPPQMISQRCNNNTLANFDQATTRNARRTDLNSNSHNLTGNGSVYRWVLRNGGFQYMTTFPYWPINDSPYGSTWVNNWVRGS